MSVVRFASPILALLALAACVHPRPGLLDPVGEDVALAARPEALEGACTAGPSSHAWFPIAADVRLADGLSRAEANAVALFHAPAIVEARMAAHVTGAEVLESGRLGAPRLFVGPRFSLDDGGLTFPASLSVEVPLTGELGAERCVAEADLEAARHDVMAVEVETLARVRDAYVRLAAVRAEAAALARARHQGEELLGWVERLAEAGEVDALTRHLAALERDEAELASEEAAAKEPRIRAEVLGLIGLLPTATVEIATTEADLEVPAPPPSDPATSRGHPRLRAAAARFGALDRAVRLATLRQVPRLAVGPEFEWSDGAPELGFGVGAPVPLSGRRQAEVRTAVTRREAARAAWQAERLDLARREAEARGELERLEPLLLRQEARLPAGEEAEARLSERLALGQADVVAALAARAAIARARVRALQTRARVAALRLEVGVHGGAALSCPVPGSPEGSR
jgi:outer membrane protein TolC